MVRESLSQNFLLTEARKGIDMFISGGTTLVSHLMFADDVLCFSRANKKSMVTIMAVLDEFSLFSGLKFNEMESSIAFSESCRNKKKELRSILGFQMGSFPIRYWVYRLLAGV